MIPLKRMILLAMLYSPLAFAAQDIQPDSSHAVVIKDDAIVYESPDILSNVLRLLYAGEVIEVRDVIQDPSETKWAKLGMGGVTGYVKFSDIQFTGTATVRNWKPPVILRDDHPLAFSLKAGTELFGLGLGIHYLPFSRLGSTFSVGSIIDEGEMKGTALSLGVISYLALRDLSPFIETGFTRLSYHEMNSTLRVNAFYLSIGMEWIFPSGVFVNVMGTYMRSADVEVSFDYDNAKAGLTQVPDDFGILDPGDDNTFQFLLPGVSVGFAF